MAYGDGAMLLARDEKRWRTTSRCGGTARYLRKVAPGRQLPVLPRIAVSGILAHGGGGIGQTPDYWGNEYINDTYFHNGEPESFEAYCTDVV